MRSRPPAVLARWRLSTARTNLPCSKTKRMLRLSWRRSETSWRGRQVGKGKKSQGGEEEDRPRLVQKQRRGLRCYRAGATNSLKQRGSGRDPFLPKPWEALAITDRAYKSLPRAAVAVFCCDGRKRKRVRHLPGRVDQSGHAPLRALLL